MGDGATTTRMPATKAIEVLRVARADETGPETGPETVAEDDWRLALDAALHALARAAKIEALGQGDLLFYIGTTGGALESDERSNTWAIALQNALMGANDEEGWEHAP